MFILGEKSRGKNVDEPVSRNAQNIQIFRLHNYVNYFRKFPTAEHGENTKHRVKKERVYVSLIEKGVTT